MPAIGGFYPSRGGGRRLRRREVPRADHPTEPVRSSRSQERPMPAPIGAGEELGGDRSERIADALLDEEDAGWTAVKPPRGFAFRMPVTCTGAQLLLQLLGVARPPGADPSPSVGKGEALGDTEREVGVSHAVLLSEEIGGPGRRCDRPGPGVVTSRSSRGVRDDGRPSERPRRAGADPRPVRADRRQLPSRRAPWGPFRRAAP